MRSLDKRSESQAASRFRSLLTRWVGPRAVTAAQLEEIEADHGQPSRQFLHSASAIQKPPCGSWQGWLMVSSTRIREVCSIAT